MNHSSHVSTMRHAYVRSVFLSVVCFNNPAFPTVIGSFPLVPRNHIGSAGAVVIGISYGDVSFVDAGKLPLVLPGIVPGPVIRQIANGICRRHLSLLRCQQILPSISSFGSAQDTTTLYQELPEIFAKYLPRRIDYKSIQLYNAKR